MSAIVPITKSALAERLQVSTRTLERWINQGDLPPPRRLGTRRVYWHPHVIEQWLERALGDRKQARKRR